MATIQEAADVLLQEEGHPLPAKELAQRALSRHIVVSGAKNPVDSLAQTVEKNIRDGVYNRPELYFVAGGRPRLIGRASWRRHAGSPPSPVRSPATTRPVATVEVPAAVVDDVRLACDVGLAPSLEATVTLLIQRGLKVSAREIEAAVSEKIERFKAGGD